MSPANYQRPPKLYRYSDRQWLERALTLGEFRLRPPVESLQIGHLHNSSRASPQLLTLSLSCACDDALYDEFSNSDCCLVINDPEEFGERIHRAAQRLLPSWTGIDGAITYGKQNPLGAAFTKNPQSASQKEWLFAWRPTQPTMALRPIIIKIGSIEAIAELRPKSS
ncbi:hypothetical protein [Glaciimonas immobilis]|uniref:Uncharacterized protein n=1 Tax=Glaciimonas immobilis TaxID=728004 RepID=A0A840RRV8_9BURK|nr:hypothetical protein [Glaciimonas immobilis]KAF3996908.1 hypothetical protein HAV38_14545 [Glaciimonas immobilis]MBB5199728.1 hypothetical protein [Glaciimonas immobilis]